MLFRQKKNVVLFYQFSKLIVQYSNLYVIVLSSVFIVLFPQLFIRGLLTRSFYGQQTALLNVVLWRTDVTSLS